MTLIFNKGFHLEFCCFFPMASSADIFSPLFLTQCAAVWTSCNYSIFQWAQTGVNDALWHLWDWGRLRCFSPVDGLHKVKRGSGRMAARQSPAPGAECRVWASFLGFLCGGYRPITTLCCPRILCCCCCCSGHFSSPLTSSLTPHHHRWPPFSLLAENNSNAKKIS